MHTFHSAFIGIAEGISDVSVLPCVTMHVRDIDSVGGRIGVWLQYQFNSIQNIMKLNFQLFVLIGRHLARKHKACDGNAMIHTKGIFIEIKQ